MAAMTENAKKVFEYVKAHEAENITTADIAEATGIPKKSVDPLVTALDKRRGVVERVPAEVELEDGTHKAIKIVKMTEKGYTYDPDATEE